MPSLGSSGPGALSVYLARLPTVRSSSCSSSSVPASAKHATRWRKIGGRCGRRDAPCIMAEYERRRQRSLRPAALPPDQSSSITATLATSGGLSASSAARAASSTPSSASPSLPPSSEAMSARVDDRRVLSGMMLSSKTTWTRVLHTHTPRARCCLSRARLVL
eukprot:2235185-Prymnesium_polylepis.1